MKKEKKFRVPHTFVIIFWVIVAVAILTYIIPAGEYDRVEDPETKKKVVDVTSFHQVEQSPVGPFKMFESIPGGMKDAASIIFFVFVISGSFQMIQATGAINSGIGHALRNMKSDKVIIPVAMILFSVMGFAIGAAEEVIPFIPIAIILARGFGYDDMVGMALVSTGAASGFAGGMFNPFTTGIAQGIAGLPLYSGLLFRSIGYVLFMVIAIIYVQRYANKVKKDPTKSLLFGVDREAIEEVNPEETSFDLRHKLVLLVFVIGMGVMVFGVLKYEWFTSQISALFLIMGIVASVIGGLKMNDMAKEFVKGAKAVVFGALVIGFARAILVIMKDGKIIDSSIYYMSEGLKNFPVYVTSIGMFWMNTIINFFIPSGSGQASTMVPIMAPLADIVGMTRQTAVLCVTYGDALSNQIIPTSGALLAGLSMAKIPYDRWFKYNWKLVVIWTLVATALVGVAAMIGLGPM